MKQQRLHQLYKEHRGKVSDKWSIYLATYEEIFASLEERPIAILEIGIQNGGSLEIMAKYFPAAERIVGCDINPRCERLEFTDARITVIVGDAVTDEIEARIRQVSSAFDIVIDDGSHTSGDIVGAFARYFPLLRDGGVFVAEDLHCSYWADFQGGLHHPESSLSFFRQLVDVLNHEHWGVPGDRASAVSDFVRTYGITLSEDVLASIHSVEFVNSMCVVRKARSQDNALGQRVVAGDEAYVDPAVLDARLNGTFATARDESTNPRSQASVHDRLSEQGRLLDDERRERAQARGQLRMSMSRAERLSQDLMTQSARCAQLSTQVEVQAATIDALRNSTSWRLTSPVRWVGGKLHKVRRGMSLARVVWRRAGSLPRILRRLVGVLRTSGLAGVRTIMRDIEAEEVAATLDSAARAVAADYGRWIQRFDTLDEVQRAAMVDRMAHWEHRPLVSIVMPTYNANPAWMAEAVESVRRQLYERWELCIADDASSDPESISALQALAEKDARIKLVRRPKNGHISAASNSALEIAVGAWIVLMDHDDLLAESALFWVVDAINRNSGAKLIYSDEDKVDEQGQRFDPYFKSDWNIDLFRSQNMFSHLGAFDIELVREVGGFRIGLEGSQDYDLVLRCIERVSADQIVHVPRVLYHWRVHAQSTASSTEAKPYAQLAGERALNEHLSRLGIKGQTRYIGHGYRTDYALPVPPPLVSIIVPTRNAVGLMRQCMESLVTLTAYAPYEVIVLDNGSDDLEALAYLDGLTSDARFTVIRHDAPFNYSELNNIGVAQARGAYVCLLNNDVEIISPGWLSEMVSIAAQPGVGAVGARLWYPDGTLQHGGVVLGVGGVASHSHKGAHSQHHGYFGRAALQQSFSAVTAACLLVSKAHYDAVGGLDEAHLSVAFNDVDFCLRLREIGLRNVWTPYAELIHHESVSRGQDDAPEKQARFNREVAYMLERWGDLLRNDPAYNPNLTLAADDFSLAWPPRLPATY